MSKGNRKAKVPKHSMKMVTEAFIPAGAPRTPESKRYSLSYAGIDEMLSAIGGKTNAR